MLLKVLLLLKTGNFSDWIGSRVACNAPVIYPPPPPPHSHFGNNMKRQTDPYGKAMK